jgi:nucleoside-diphosphate-sugar epimerase
VSKVLVTGATGFSGTALCRALTKKGEDVVAFVRKSSNIDALKSMGVHCQYVEINDSTQIEAAFESFSTIYHLAAAYRTEHADRATFQQINVTATEKLLAAARNHSVGRFVHCSTVGVQGEIEQCPADETYRYQPGDHYQTSKLQGEQLALGYMQRGLDVCVVRPAGLYGPEDTRFLKLFRAISRGRFLMIGSGQSLYHLTYIDDFVQGLLLAGQHPAAAGEIFTIAGPEYSSLNHLASEVAKACNVAPSRLKIPLAPVSWAATACEKICRPLGLDPPLYPRRVDFFKLNRAFSIHKAIDTIGYSPAYPLSRGLRETADGYAEKQLL